MKVRRPTRAPVLVALIALVAVAASLGCESLDDMARDDFAREFSCPMNRVEVRPRTDIEGYTLVHGPRPAPPKDIANDPGRLAVWQKDQDERRSHDFGTMYEVRGCSHGKLYLCSRSVGASHGSQSSLCSGYSYPAGVSRW
jgi:hypothetical protein